jgi:hypothetical protein
MSLHSLPPSARRQAHESKILLGPVRYMEAIACARMGRSDSVIINHVLIHGWMYPRALGIRKAKPVVLVAGSLAAYYRLDRGNVLKSIKRLVAGRVLIVAGDGAYRLNPDWKQWATAGGVLLIHPLCYANLERGPFPDHNCPPLDRPLSWDEDGDPIEPDDPDAEAPAPRPDGAGAAHLAPAPKAARAPAGARAELNSLSENTGLRKDIYIPTDTILERAEQQRDIYTEDNPSSAGGRNHEPDPGHPRAADPGDAREDGRELSRGVHPTIEPFEPFPAAGSLAGAGCLPGRHTPDPAILAAILNLIQTRIPFKELEREFYKHQYIWKTEWMMRALKRTILKNPSVRSFGYIRKILIIWDAVGEPDHGDEEKFDDLLNPITPEVGPAFTPERPGKPDLNRLMKERYGPDGIFRIAGA